MDLNTLELVLTSSCTTQFKKNKRATKMKFVLTHYKVKEKFVLNKEQRTNYFNLTFTTTQNYFDLLIIWTVIMLLNVFFHAI